MTVFWIIVALFVGAWLHSVLSKEEDCPRAIMGYHCKGNRCDHSEIMTLQARLAMAESRR